MLRETLYNTYQSPRWGQVVLIAIAYLIVFIPLIIFPTITLLSPNPSPTLLTNTISIALISSTITTLLISLRKGIGAACFLPVSSATQLFAASLLANKSGGLALVLGMSMISGIVVMLMSPFIRYLRLIFNSNLAGFIQMLLGIWVAVLGVDALFFPKDLTPLIFHPDTGPRSAIDTKQTLIGFVSLSVMLGYRLYGSNKHRLNCILYGSLVGWIISLFTGTLEATKLTLFQQTSWFHWPHPYWLPSLTNYRFQSDLLLPFVLGGILTALQVFSMITMIDRESGEDSKKIDLSRISKGNMAVGLGTFISSFLGAPQSPNPAAFGAQYATGAYTRRVAYIFAGVTLILACLPKIAIIFLTIPASVRGATIMFLGAGMFMTGFDVIAAGTFDRFQGVTFGLALMLGASIGIIPEFYRSTTLWIRGVTDPTFLVAVSVFIILNLLFLIRLLRNKKSG